MFVFIEKKIMLGTVPKNFPRTINHREKVGVHIACRLLNPRPTQKIHLCTIIVKSSSGLIYHTRE